MTNKHAARLGGDRYQHHYSWWLILALKLPEENVEKVIVENGQAGQVDDVTVHYKPEAALPDRFYQVKYHVDNRETYSTKSLIKADRGEKSLLEKFWSTWKKLREEIRERSIELYLISTWTWNDTGFLGSVVSGVTDRIKVDDFMSASSPSEIVKIREDWQRVLGADDEDFRAFIDCLHFRFGYSASVLVNELVTERMKRLRLKTDPMTMKAIDGIVSDWIIHNTNEISLAMLDETLREHDFYLPEEQERSLTIHMDTIAETERNGVDYLFDWRDYFVDGKNPGEKGYQLKDPANWSVLRDELYHKKIEINRGPCRLIKVDGASRLPAWFAFGYVFSEVAKYRIEFHHKDRNDKEHSWRTDAPASKDFSLVITSDQGSPGGEPIHGSGTTVAIGISVSEASKSIDENVRHYLLTQQKENVAALLLLRSEPAWFRNAGDAVALANWVKDHGSVFINRHQAKRVLLFYRGPAGGACFIGHRLNKIGPQTTIQIMELQADDPNAPYYAPSFLLT